MPSACVPSRAPTPLTHPGTALRDLSIRHVASWRRDEVVYDVHVAHYAQDARAIVINALGPGAHHRFVVLPDNDPPVWLEAGWQISDEERTVVADAMLRAASVTRGRAPGARRADVSGLFPALER